MRSTPGRSSSTDAPGRSWNCRTPRWPRSGLAPPHRRSSWPIACPQRFDLLLTLLAAAWLDRRGALHLPHRPDMVVPSVVAAPERVPDPLTVTGLDLAVSLLSKPTEPWGVRSLARSTGRTPGRVSEILAALRDEGLVRPDGRPVVPELFWEVSSRWTPRWRPLATVPDPTPHLARVRHPRRRRVRGAHDRDRRPAGRGLRRDGAGRPGLDPQVRSSRPRACGSGAGIRGPLSLPSGGDQ